MTLELKSSNRLARLADEFLFDEIERIKKDAIANGRPIIDFGVGDPDLPTPNEVVSIMQEEVANTANHKYSTFDGLPSFRKAIASLMKTEFNVDIDSDKECITLIGCKEGISHLPMGYINKDDTVIVPEPAYPGYNSGTILSNGDPYFVPLKMENNFLVDLDAIPESVLERAKMFWVNYPNNPTSAQATLEFFEKLIHIGKKYNILICNDAAYSHLIQNESKPISILQVKDAKDYAVEFFSFSKMLNMCGWRIGFAAGNQKAVSLLGKVKANLDSGCFNAIQNTMVRVINNGKIIPKAVKEINQIYKERRNVLTKGLKECGFEVFKSNYTFYVWVKTKNNMSSNDCSIDFLKKADLIVTPGAGFGPSGEGFVRMALSIPVSKIQEAVERLKKL